MGTPERQKHRDEAARQERRNARANDLVQLVVFLVGGAMLVGVLMFLGIIPVAHSARVLVDDDDNSRPEPQVVEPSRTSGPEERALAWSCDWAPTMNDDWHDDVLCSNGIQSERPYLLPNQSFVEQSEIMEAARQYEAQLNG